MKESSAAFLPKSSNTAPFLLIGISFARLPNPENRPPALREAQSGTIALSELAGEVILDVAMDMGSAEQAAQIRDMVQGFVAMAALNAEQNPEMADLANRAQISAEGGTARLKLRMPAAQLNDAVQKARERRRPQVPPEP